MVRGNTLESFDAAAEIGVDMVEFDVRGHAGRLVVAHTFIHARRGDCLPFERALAHLAGPRFDGIDLNVDIKLPGCEAAAIDALRRFDLLRRSLISSQYGVTLDRVRALEPTARTAISVGGRLARRRQRWRDWRELVLAALRARRFDGLMAHHALVDEQLVEGVRVAGADVYAWTVDSAQAIRRVAQTGVTGITTNDPRLFATAL